MERISLISVLKKDISADVSPSFKAVKNAEPKIADPVKRNEKENIKNPRKVRVRNPLSPA